MENILVSNTETTATVITGLLGPTGDITPSLQQLLADTTAAKNSASTSASTASTAAGTATAAASTASTAATTATSKASEASASASSAAASASTATTSSNTATTKAAEAAASASTASTAATTATTKAAEASASAGSATTSAATATSKASEASASAVQANSSKDTVAGLLATFRRVLLGSFASDALAESFASANLIPITDGIMYENTVVDKFRIYNGTAWQDYDSSAQVSQSAAALSAAAASTSASNALASANNAAASVTTAAIQATTATTQAGIATTQAGISTTQATIATQRAQDAAAQATQAASSASVSSTQATTAGAFAGTATAQALIATNKATEAATSASAAETSAAAALVSQTAAAASATAANTSAVNSAASATTATTQAATATTQANTATAQATIATTQATAATAQATAASSSAATASTQAATATSQATIATTQATAASASATNAALSATAAANAQTAAAASATTATTQATAATAAKTAAETARDVAIVAQNNAVAVVTGGTATLTPQAGKIPLADGLGKIAKGWLTNTDLVEQTDIGTAPNEIPLNQYLGEMAYMDANTIPTIGVATANLATANVTNLMQVTEVSTVMPTLNLDFAKVKQLDPRITFTRASTGTYYDGKTRAKAEENLLAYSQEFENAAWGKNNLAASANSTTAPDGTTTAETITANTSILTGKNIAQNVSLTGQSTFSVYAKQGTHQFIQFFANSGAFGQINFDLLNGTLSATTATGSITPVGNGWYRCTATFSASITIAYIALVTSNSAVRSETWTSVGTETVFLWGAQLEQRSTATAYTPTTTQPITNYIPVLMTAASGVPRFEHNPVTGESLGLEIEEQRTNLLTYSAEFDNAAWIKTNSSIIANTIIAPDGTLTGDKVFENSTNTEHFVRQNLTVTATAHTLSFYAKAAERTLAWASLDGGSNSRWFDLSAGTTGGSNSGSGSSTITLVGNGWYRCTYTYTFAGTSSPTFIGPAINSTSTVYTGNGFSGIYIWGAQLEAGAFPTSYIPTTTAQVTRAADSASMTGVNFSSWYAAEQGTIYMEADGRQPCLTFSNANAGYANYRPFYRQPGQAGQPFISSDINVGVTSSDIYAGPTNGLPFKAAYAYANNNFAASVNGLAAVTDNSGQPALAVNRMGIGFDFGTNSTTSGLIKKITYYPQRLSNAELVEITA